MYSKISSQNVYLKGIFYGIIAGISYGMNPLFALPLYHEGMNTNSVLFYRYGFGTIFLGLWLVLRGVSLKVHLREIPALIIGGLTMAFSSLLLFLSYNYMDAGIASTILFIYPVLVAVIMAIFFHEKITLPTVFSILFSLLGVGILYRGGDGVVLSLPGILLVLVSALTYASYIVWVRESRLKKMRTDVLTFYCVMAGVPLFLVSSCFGSGLQVIPNLYSLSLVLALGFIPTMISLAATAKAIRYAGATPTAILGALEPATAIFFGVLVFGELLTARLILGLLLIVTAVLFIIVANLGNSEETIES